MQFPVKGAETEQASRKTTAFLYGIAQRSQQDAVQTVNQVSTTIQSSTAAKSSRARSIRVSATVSRAPRSLAQQHV